jgi:hypothetical protein
MTGIEPDPVRTLTRFFGGYWISTLIVRAERVRQIGCFDPQIAFCEDQDFNFRLCEITSLAYVNKPLVNADRNPSSNDLERPWDKTEVRLRNNQKMFEKWLATSSALSKQVRQSIARSLRNTHSMWANLHIENGRFDEASGSLSNALKYGLTPGLIAKWGLILLAPAFAKKIAPKQMPYLT